MGTPFLPLALNVVLVAAAQLLLKRGAAPADGAWTGLASLASPWTVAGIACYIAGFFAWIRALRRLPLSVAFPVTGAAHVLVPLGSWLLLGEAVPPLRWAGVVLVAAGVALCTVPR